MGFLSMEKGPRAAATPISPRTVYNNNNNYTADWRPWQLSPFFLIPLILISACLAATLEALAQISNRPYHDAELRIAWLDWYCEGQQHSSCVPEFDIPGLSPSDMTFENISSSKTGILTFLQPNSLSAASSFAWLYFPTLFAVLYAIFWQVVDDEVKRIEPFYQASRPGGAQGDRTIFASYISIPPILAPLQALRWRQTAVFLSSITYVLIGFVTPILQSQIFQLQPQMVQVGYFPRFSDRFEPLTREGFAFPRGSGDGSVIARFTDELDSADLSKLQNDGVPRIVVYVDPAFARAQEAILWAATLSGSLLLWGTMRRRSGMLNDTKGLAALASLASSAHPECLDRIATMTGPGGPEAEDVLKQTLVHLGCGGGGGGGDSNAGGGTSSCYGLWFGAWPTTSTGQPQSGRMSRATAWLVTAPKALGASVLRWALGSSGAQYQVLHYSISLSTLGQIVLIVMILVTGGTEKAPTSANDAFRQTVGNTTGNSVAFTAAELIVVSIVKTLWVVVEEQTTVLSPYRALHVRPRKAWPLLERDYAAIVLGARTFYAFQDGQLLLGCVTTISLLLEVGLVCFGITASMSQGTAYNADAIWIIHWIAFTVCVVIVLFIAATSRVWLAGFPYMERNPDTIAAKLSYVCQSRRLLEDVRPVVAMTREEREAHLRGIEGLYALGQVQSGVVGLERTADEGRG